MCYSEFMAEREGFEPSIRSPVCRISSAVVSTTHPPLRSRACQRRDLLLACLGSGFKIDCSILLSTASADRRQLLLDRLLQRLRSLCGQ